MLIGLTGPSTFTADCVRMVEEVYGADFVLLYHNNEANLERWVRTCDGVILAGGTDLHPMTYGGKMLKDKGLDRFDLARDRRELFVLEECRRRDIPLLGLCRGHQLLGSRLAGLRFIQNLTGPVPHSPSAEGITLKPDEPAHHVVLTGEFRALRGTHWVNSFHHQGLLAPDDARPLKPGFEVLGVTGAVVELLRGPRLISAQWHPEHDYKHNRLSRAVLAEFGAYFGVVATF